jgi:hypothetical protein
MTGVVAAVVTEDSILFHRGASGQHATRLSSATQSLTSRGPDFGDHLTGTRCG